MQGTPLNFSAAKRFCLLLCTLSITTGLEAQSIEESAAADEQLDTITIEGRQTDLTGIAQAASRGATGQAQLQQRPFCALPKYWKLFQG